jgi:SP family general alpha glucoside:H+ symporter-like MFS transporter
MSANNDIQPTMPDEKRDIEHIDQFDVKAQKAEAISAEEVEHSLSFWDAARAYPMGCFWAFVISFCIVSDNSLPCASCITDRETGHGVL